MKTMMTRICLIGVIGAALLTHAAESGQAQALKEPAGNDSLAWQWTRDEAGRVTEVKGPGGSVMRVAYAAETAAGSGEVSDVVSYGKESRRLTYDKSGRLARAAGGAASVMIAYGTNGLPAEVRTEGCPTLRYGYDALGQLTELRIGTETVLRYRYDYQRRLCAIGTPAGEIEYTYEPGQNMVIRTLPNKVLTRRLYDDEGRLIEITHADAGKMLIQNSRYLYRPDGLVDAIEERSQRGERVMRFTYDAMHRLVGVAGQGEGTSSHRYAYDERGNLEEAKTGAGESLQLTSTLAGALRSDSRGTCRTDERGHIRELPFGDGTIDYTYGENGKLATAKGQSVTYAYDALERLTERTVAGRTTRYLPDPLSDTWQPLWRRDASGNETVTVWDNGVPLLEIRGQRVTYRLEDYQGSVRVELDAAGQVVNWRDYSPYGKPVTLRDGDDLQAGFAGLPYDPVAGVYLTMARAYDPVTARFLQPDPQLRIPGASPQTHSLYVYCAGDPVNWVDVNGSYATPSESRDRQRELMDRIRTQQFQARSMQSELRQQQAEARFEQNETMSRLRQQQAEARFRHSEMMQRISGVGARELQSAQQFRNETGQLWLQAIAAQWANAGHIYYSLAGGGIGGAALGAFLKAERDAITESMPSHEAITRQKRSFSGVDALVDKIDTLQTARDVGKVLADTRVVVRSTERWIAPKTVLDEHNQYSWVAKKTSYELDMDDVGLASIWYENKRDELVGAKVNDAVKAWMTGGRDGAHTVSYNAAEYRKALADIKTEQDGAYSVWRVNIDTVVDPTGGHSRPVAEPLSHTMTVLRNDRTGDILASSSFINKDKGSYEHPLDPRNLEGAKNAIEQHLRSNNPEWIKQNIFSAKQVAVGNGHLAETYKQEVGSRYNSPEIYNFFSYNCKNDARVVGDNIRSRFEGGGWSGLSAPAPVGGVYLGGAGKALEGLGMLKGVAVDEATGNLVLLAEDGRKNALPPLRLDDVVTVFRAVYDHGQSPTVTINPDKQNPEGPTMDVVHGPGTEGTYVGWVLFECDRVMKTYQLGVDNVSKRPIASRVPGHEETVNTVFFGNRSRGSGHVSDGVWERFWIVPDVLRRYDMAANGLSLFDIPLKVKTQKMKWENGVLVDDETGESSVGAKAFTKWFSEKYGGIAEEVRLAPPKESGLTEPVAIFQELRRIATVAAVAERLRAQGQALPLWMRDYRVAAFPIATTTPSLNLSRTNGVDISSIYGGVNLAPADEDVHAFGETEGVKKEPKTKADIAFVEESKPKVTALVTRLPEAARLPLDAERPVKIALAGGEKVAAVALPGATSQALAPNQQAVSDLSVPIGMGRSIALTRYYSSFFDPDGEYGKGWTLNLPTLKMTQAPVSRDGKGYMVDEVRTLSSPLGTYNIRFDKIAKVALFGNMELRVAKDHPEIAGVGYGKSPLFSQDLHKVFFLDGSEWHFAENGNLLVDEKAGMSTCYERDKEGRVSRIVGVIGKQKMGAIVLNYDNKGRIERATVEQPDELRSLLPVEVSESTYEYGKDGRLIAVLQRASGASDSVRAASYTYMGPHLISMQGADKRKQTFDYNTQGQVTQREQDGQRIDYSLTAADGKTTFTQSAAGGMGKVSTVYDERLRPVAMELGKGAEVRWEYGVGKASVERVIEKGRTLVTREVSADGKTVTEVDHESGETYKVERDETGQPSVLSYNGAPVVTVERLQKGTLKSLKLGHTTEVVPLVNQEGVQNGVLVKDPNSETRWIQQDWDVLGRPTKIGDSTGFEYVLSYDSAGRLKSFGRPTKDGQIRGASLTYDVEGRVTGVESSWGTEQREYAKGGLLSKVVSKKGGAVAEQRFDGLGRLAISRAYDGGETMWTYASDDPTAAPVSITLPYGGKIDYKETQSPAATTTSTQMGPLLVELKTDMDGRRTSLAWGTSR